MAAYDKSAKLFFERRYDYSRFDFNRDIEVPAMLKTLGNVRNKTILDLGCGFGDHAMHLSKKGAKKIIGLDISSELIKIAKEQNIKNAEFYIHDINNKLKFKNNSFDIIFSSLVIEYVKNLDQLFSEVNRSLKKGGIFAFSRFHPIWKLMAQTKEAIVGYKILSKKNIKIFGDYFDEAPKLQYVGSLGNITAYNYTFETIIRTALKHGFELIDYADPKPIKQSARYHPWKYKLTSTLPAFSLFKFRKK
jgi:ubiquinone/menaquinone biosynthesis C-methylase UbiE